MRKRISTVAAIVALSAALAGRKARTSEQECLHRGGEVIADDVKYTVGKNGKRIVTREFECVKDGVELFEWETRAG